MIGSAQSAHLVDSVILSRHTACLAPPNVAILRMYTSSESHFLLPAKRLALRMDRGSHFPLDRGGACIPAALRRDLPSEWVQRAANFD